MTRRPRSSSASSVVVGGRCPGEGIEVYVDPGHRDRGARPTTARSSRSPRPTRPAWASASSSTDRRRGQPGRLRLGRVARPDASWPPRWPTPGTTPRFATPDPDVRPGPARRRGGHGDRPVGRRGGLDAHGEEGRTGHRARAGDAGRRPRIRQVSSADYSRQPGRGGAGLDHRHLVVPAPHERPSCPSTPSPGRGRETQTGSGLQRRPGTGRPRPRRGDGRRRRAGRAACWAPPRRASGHCTVVFDPRVVSTLLSVVVVGALGRGRA